MKPGCYLSLLAYLVISAAATGQEPAQLQFVRALKNEYGAKLADDYLRRLQQTPEYTPRLALEAALLKLDMAESASNASERVRLTREAETELQKYRGPEAGLITIKILSLKARGLYLKASREDDDPETRKKVLAQAIGSLQDVRQRLDGTMTQLNAQLAQAKDDAAKKNLQQSLVQAEFDQGVNLFELAEMKKFEDAGELTAARGMFDKVVLKKDVDPGLAVQARVWVARCMEHSGEAKAKITEQYQGVLRDNTAGSEAAKREAAYYEMLYAAQKLLTQGVAAPDVKDVTSAMQAADNWLKQHGEQASATQVAGAHYVLGLANFEKSNHEGNAKPPAEMSARKKLYDLARTHFREAERTENEYSGKARRYKLQCFIFVQGWSNKVSLTDADKLKEATAAVPLAKLTTFDDLVDRAQFEMAILGEKLKGSGQPDEKVNQIRNEGIKRAIDALQAAVALAKTSGKVPADQVGQARMMLTYAYLTIDDPVHAIDEGQKLVDERSAQATDVAPYVIQAYTGLIRQQKDDFKKRSKEADQGRGGPDAFKLNKLRDESEFELKKRTGEFYTFMDKVIAGWGEDQAADTARHQKAMMLYYDGKKTDAIAMLAQVRPIYPAYVSVRFQLALMASNNPAEEYKPADTDPDRTPYKDWKERGLVVAGQLQPPAPGSDPSVFESYLRAKMLLASPWFKTEKYKEMDAMFGPLLNNVATGVFPLPDKETKLEVQASLLKCVLLSAYGKADQLVQAATKADPKAVKFQETRPFFDPVLPLIVNPQDGSVTEVAVAVMKPMGKDGARDAETARFRDTFMEMILRAYLLDGKGVEAARLVRALNKMYPDKDAKGQDSDGGALTIGDALMTQMINYTADLRAAARLAEIAKKNDVATAKKTEADKLSAGLKAMLGDISKTPQGLKPAWNRLVAKGYLSMNDPANAAVFAQQDTGAPAAGAPAAKVQAYVEERLLYVRALREAGNLPGAEKAIADLKKQDDALVAAKQTALFAGEPMLMFEQASLLDAKKKFDESWKDWKTLANKTAGKVGKSRMEKELYFQAYCSYVRAGFKSATDDDPKKLERINGAAKSIIDLEGRWPDMGGDVSKVRFLQMLDSEPVLKQAYDNLKGDKKGS